MQSIAEKLKTLVSELTCNMSTATLNYTY